MPICARISAGIEAWVIIAGCSIRLSTPPKDSASVKTCVRSKNRVAGSNPPFAGRHHAAKALHLAFGQIMLWMAVQAWIINPLDFLMLFQPGRDGGGIFTMCLHAYRQSLQTAQNHKGIKGRHNSPNRILQVGQALGNRPSPAPAMPPTISLCPFRYLVAEWKTISMPSSGAAGSKCWQRYYRTQDEVAGLTNHRHLRQIAQLEQGIGRRFDPEHFGVGLMAAFIFSTSEKSTKLNSGPWFLCGHFPSGDKTRRKDHRPQLHDRQVLSSKIVLSAAKPEAKQSLGTAF